MRRRTFLLAGLAPILLTLPGPIRARAEHGTGRLLHAVRDNSATIDAHVDPRLREYPALYAMLRGEARNFIDTTRREVARARQENRDLFDVGRWFYDRRYELRAAAGRYVSVTVFHAEYTGGAHPNSTLDTILWDRMRGRPAGISELFRETRDGGPTMSALAASVRAGLAAEKKQRGVEVAPDPAQDEWIKPVVAKLDTLGAVTLAPSTEGGKASGLTFTFSPYAVGPYVEGYYTVFIPADELTQFLAPGAKSLFGGRRPENDNEFY